MMTITRAASARRRRWRLITACPPSGFVVGWIGSRRDRFLVGGLPAPRARAVAALGDARLVDLGDDVAIAGKQRLGRAHLGAQRQLAFDQTVVAVLGVVLSGVRRIRAAGAAGALGHL